MTAYSPPFGQANLTNCERELIHLAGSIQPHGLLLVFDGVTEPGHRVLQASANAGQLVQRRAGRPDGPPAVCHLPPALDARPWPRPPHRRSPENPAPLQVQLPGVDGRLRTWEGALHPTEAGPQALWVLELEPVPGTAAWPPSTSTARR